MLTIARHTTISDNYAMVRTLLGTVTGQTNLNTNKLSTGKVALGCTAKPQIRLQVY